MAYTRVQARKLLTATEFDLFEQTTGPALKTLTLARLRSKLGRARQLRDKFQDLYRRQTVALRGSARAGAAATNERTQAKAVIFAEVLARVQAQLDKVEAAAAKAAAKKPAAKKAVAKKAVAKKAVAKKPAAKAPAKKTVSLTQAVKKAVAKKAPAAKKAAPKSKKAASGKAPAATKSLAATPKPRKQAAAAARAPALKTPRNQAISAHVGARNQRAQARRDKRG
jgi:hypothetical protein